MTSVPDPADARRALAAAATASARVRRQARWPATYLTVFAGGFAGVTLVLGLVQPLALRMALFGAGWPLLLLATVGWASRKPASPLGLHRRAGPYWVATGVLYGTVLLVGTPRFLGQPAYWLPAAALVGAPLLLAALRERAA